MNGCLLHFWDVSYKFLAIDSSTMSKGIFSSFRGVTVVTLCSNEIHEQSGSWECTYMYSIQCDVIDT